MTHVPCPWCEAPVETVEEAAATTCPECLTTWSYETVDEGLDLALAA